MKCAFRQRLYFCIAICAIMAAGAMFPGKLHAWEAMQQLAIEEAYRIALENNELISAAAEQLNQAEADVNIARSPMLPQVDLLARAVQQKETAFVDLDRYVELSAQATQSLYTGGKLKSIYDASRYAAQGQTFRFYRARQEVLFAVARGFYNVLFSRRAIEIADNQLIRAQRQLQQAKQRQEVGLVDMTAVLRAQVQVAAAREDIERAKNQYIVAMEQLALEMGVPEPPESLQEPESISEELMPLEQYVDLAFENRRDLQAAEEAFNAASEQVNAEQADFIPDFALQGRYSRANEDELYYGEDYVWDVSVIGSYPLFTGFRNRAEITRARAVKAEAVAGWRRLQQEIRVAVRSAYADIQTQKRVITSLEDQLESARANYRQVTAQFEEGLASAVDVVDAETALNEAERRLAITYYLYQLDRLNLRVATGTFAAGLLDKPGTE